MPDSGAANSPNLCTATKPPEGCHAIVRSTARLAQQHPRPAPGRGPALQAATRSAVLDPRHCHRRQFLSFHRDLHQGASPPVERCLRSALAAGPRPYLHSIHPPGPRSASGRADLPSTRRRPAGCHNRPIATQHRPGWQDTQAQARRIVQLKDNQPTLLQKRQTACASQRPVSSDTELTSGRNRHETRSADVFSATRAVAGTEWKSLIKSIVRVTREVMHRDAKTGLWSSTSEVAYYVANSPASACLAATAIRHHWHVENTLHYTRDVTFQEDQSRIRHNPGVFARLRSFAYNVLCRNRTSTFSQDRYAAALAGFDALAKWCFS